MPLWIGKFRKLIGEQGVEELLSQTITVALNLKVFSKKALETVVVDSTVQPKAIAHPTDSRLLEVARQKLVEAAKDAGIKLKQTFAKEGKQLTRKARGYAHARQFRRMRKPINRQRTIVAKLARQIESQIGALADGMKHSIHEALHKAQLVS
jgi:IS5 family transposase